ncbi:MAG: hypothetical protein GY798_19115 [Hyphomicrobiales bacterium]|nr:hypothetical protein [Hyphomicrobiales bacterium]
MRSRRAVVGLLAAFILGLGAPLVPSSAQDSIVLPAPRPAHAPKATAASKTITTAPEPPAGGYPYGHVIVLRGLHNIWSRGMDALAKRLEEAGAPVILDNHSRWRRLADETIAKYKKDQSTAPIIIIGHSLGGDAALVMANWMIVNGVPVRLIVVFDAVAQLNPVMGGVEEVINFYRPRGYGQEVTGSDRFNGTIVNIDLTKRKDVNHLNMDKSEELQAWVFDKTMTILREWPATQQ